MLQTASMHLLLNRIESITTYRYTILDLLIPWLPSFWEQPLRAKQSHKSIMTLRHLYGWFSMRSSTLSWAQRSCGRVSNFFWGESKDIIEPKHRTIKACHPNSVVVYLLVFPNGLATKFASFTTTNNTDRDIKASLGYSTRSEQSTQTVTFTTCETFKLGVIKSPNWTCLWY